MTHSTIDHLKAPTRSEIADLSAAYGLLKIGGKDAKKLLQGQITTDVEKISSTNGAISALCNPQGRVISLFYLFLLNEDFYLVMPHDMIDLTLAALKKYAIFYKVEMENKSEALAILGFREPTLSTVSPELATVILPLSHPHRIMIGEKETVNAFINTMTNEAATIPAKEWKVITLTAGIPDIYAETSGKYLPHDLNLPQLQAVSFDKGCYTGQEIIARMQYRGKLKNHLYPALLSNTSKPILNDVVCYTEEQQSRNIGSVVDYVEITNNEYAILLILEDQYKEKRLTLEQAPETNVTLLT